MQRVRARVGPFAAHAGAVRAVACSPDGKTVVSGGADGLVRFWQLATGRELLTLTPRLGTIAALAFNKDGTILAAGGAGRVRLWYARAEEGQKRLFWLSRVAWMSFLLSPLFGVRRFPPLSFFLPEEKKESGGNRRTPKATQQQEKDQRDAGSEGTQGRRCSRSRSAMRPSTSASLGYSAGSTARNGTGTSSMR